MLTTQPTISDKLVLGSAQFGLDYGISNIHGKVQLDDVKDILSEAIRSGITTIDTAAAYGDSESVIGNALKELQLPIKIITKYPAGADRDVKEFFNESLEKLQVKKVHGYLLHSFSIYKTQPDILNQLQELKAEGKVQKIGVSIYHPHEAEELLDKQEQIDILQFPYNIFDQRFESLLPALADKEIEPHIRSVFLQGLFFLSPDLIPSKLKHVIPKINILHQIAQNQNLPTAALLLGFVSANPFINKIILGVESAGNLRENIININTTLSKEVMLQLQNLREEDENVILPYNWN